MNTAAAAFFISLENHPMTPNARLVAVLLGALLCLGGCTGHYTFDDDEYRPLGDPTSIHRGK
jgi:hypothetical protein